MYGVIETRVRIELLELVEKLNPFQQHVVREIYLRALEGTNPKLLDHTIIDYECALRFFDSIVENLGKIINNADLEFPAKNQIKILYENLCSLRFYLMDLPLSDSNQKLDNVMFRVQDLTIHTGTFIYFSMCKHDNKFLVMASSEKITLLLAKIESVTSDSDHFIMPRSWQSNFPKTNELGYLDFILKNLKDRLLDISQPTDPLADQLNTIYKELVEVKEDFGKVAKPWNESEEGKALFSRYRDVAYQTEYFADSFFCGIVPMWSPKMGMDNLVKDLCKIKAELKIVLREHINDGTSKSLSFISAEAKSLNSKEVLNSEDNVRNNYDNDDGQLVGFEDEVNKIRDEIMGGSDQLTILSITGMPGLGKSTITNSVYKDPAVTMWFHARAWCSVSQVYNKENLLLDILLQVWKLVRLWIAEGFVQPKAGLSSSLELEAENYLNTLIDRSLVMIAKRSYNGGAKACQIHDLLHDFCIDRAKEERFLLRTKRSDSHSFLTDSEMHQQYRLCIFQSCTKTVPQVRAGHFESRIRSLFGMAGNLNKNPNSRDKPLSKLFLTPSWSRFRYYDKLRGVDVFLKFRLLRVLDFGNLDIVAQGSFDIITQLVHLVYLSLKVLINEIPDEIENLKNLETLVLTAARWELMVLPKTIWNMINLKHIQIRRGAIARFPSEFSDSYNNLDGLTSLSCLFIRDGFELVRMMRKVTNLKKLKCTLSYYDLSSIFNLDFLHQLEELSICTDFGQFIYPSCLTKLTIRGLVPVGDEISVIAELPNLEVLKLVNVRLGNEWCLKEGEFKKLRSLTVENIDIDVLDASMEHLPRLEQLVLEVCRYLDDLPSLGESPFLKLIAVRYCNTSTVASAQRIQEDQHEMGNLQFKLDISGDHWDQSRVEENR